MDFIAKLIKNFTLSFLLILLFLGGCTLSSNNEEKIKEEQIVTTANQIVINYFSKQNMEVELTGYEFISTFVAPQVTIDGHIKGSPEKNFTFFVNYKTNKIEIRAINGFSLPDDVK